MQYFVSIENCDYFHWQIELLIESFNKHNLQDQLIIGVANGSPHILEEYSKNFLTHKRKFSHDNIGKSIGYLPANRVVGAISAIKHGLIDGPFTIIHPDMVLMKPPQIEKDFNLFFSTTTETEDLRVGLEPEIAEIAKNFSLKRTEMPEWIPIGDVVILNNLNPINEKFLNDLYHKIIRLSQTLPAGTNFYKCGLILNCYENIGPPQWKYKVLDLERTLLDFQTAPFIHYKHGIPPAFHKKHYYRGEFCLGINPYDTMLKNNPTPITEYVNSLIRDYLDR